MAGRLQWRGVLLAPALHALLVAGILWSTTVVAARRDPRFEPPPVEPPAEPGEPRRKVPRLEGSVFGVLAAGTLALLGSLAGILYILPEVELAPAESAALAGLALFGAALAVLLARYAEAPAASGELRSALTPQESSGLGAWLRTLALSSGLGAVSLALRAAGQVWLEVELSLLQFAVIAGLCVEPLARCLPALWSWWNLRSGGLPTQLPAVNALLPRVLASRLNPVAAAFDVLDDLLGIDIRSSWALAFVRRSLAPLTVAVVVAGWLSTGLSMVHADEQAVKERFGRPVPGDALGPGLHVMFPWPVDRLRRVSTGQVRRITIGHEEEEEVPAELAAALDPGDASDEVLERALAEAQAGEEGPESRLWARQHADEEYTLLLGDGRDLVTIDALLYYRVADPERWLYGMQNPEAALRSLTYRAVMSRVISQTLDDALGQDFHQLSASLESQIQAEADLYELGVEVVDFSLGALHPPVSVAEDYQAVVSAQIARDTDRVSAEAYRVGRLSNARAESLSSLASAQATAAQRRAAAVGEAAAFEGLRATVRTDEQRYRFRRRLDALQENLHDRPLVIIDERIERDGAQLWLKPEVVRGWR
ncbi:MAG: hypothetical protein CMJ34_13925 [Phycisphaerae bacterium]|nr:hypothetical protein [Phycisphaerae bacterium]